MITLVVLCFGIFVSLLCGLYTFFSFFYGMSKPVDAAVNKAEVPKRRVTVLISHGMPPKDFPESDRKEFFRLHAQHHNGAHAGAAEQSASVLRYRELESRMRSWPRTPLNDQFHHSSIELGRELERLGGEPVIVCFNEFCDPDVPSAFAEASARGAVEVRVITPMMIRGGSHSDIEIPEMIASEKNKYPHIRFRYVWPFQPAQIAGFLSARLTEEETHVQ